MYQHIIKLNYDEDFTVPLGCTYKGMTDGTFVKIDKPTNFKSENIIGYTLLKNQIILKTERKEVVTQGLFMKDTRYEQYEVFSHLEDIYLYYRKNDSIFHPITRFASNKLIKVKPEEVQHDIQSKRL